VPLQPAKTTVVVVTARSSKVFIRNIGILLTAWPAQRRSEPQRTLAGGMENHQR